jgi:hypothetical protein
MSVHLSRRSLLSLAPLAVLAPSQAPPPKSDSVSPAFPSHAPELAREMVSVSHGNVARVRELLAGRPALANASWDWGYGDWESALGAASHVGNREIAALLLDAGARPSLFSAAMLGQLDVVKAFVTASPGIQKTRGPHGLTLMWHARAGGPGAAEVVTYLESVGGADARYTNEPLAQEDAAAITGTYGFGADPTERLTVSMGKQSPEIQRPGAFARVLYHQGNRVFHPAGAPAVRLRFAAGARSATITIEDGPLVVTASRA